MLLLLLELKQGCKLHYRSLSSKCSFDSEEDNVCIVTLMSSQVSQKHRGSCTRKCSLFSRPKCSWTRRMCLVKKGKTRSGIHQHIHCIHLSYTGLLVPKVALLSLFLITPNELPRRNSLVSITFLGLQSHPFSWLTFLPVVWRKGSFALFCTSCQKNLSCSSNFCIVRNDG